MIPVLYKYDSDTLDVQNVLSQCCSLLVAHDLDLASVRQQFELDFSVISEIVKLAVQTAVADGEPNGKALSALQAAMAAMKDQCVTGTTRLTSTDDGDLQRLVLGLGAMHDHPLQGQPWRWTPKVGQAAT